MESIEFWNRLGFNDPVGRVNSLRPLGHSGHLKLQCVVGSNEMLIGIPQ